VTICNKLASCVEELIAPRQNPKLEDHSLSDCNALINYVYVYFPLILVMAPFHLSSQKINIKSCSYSATVSCKRLNLTFTGESFLQKGLLSISTTLNRYNEVYFRKVTDILIIYSEIAI
jgi:hypothetical protein